MIKLKTKTTKFLIFFLTFVLSATVGTSSNNLYRKDTNGEFVTFISPFYAIAFAKDFPMMAYFNIESGGRSRRLMDKSLLRSGLGGTVVNRNEDSFGVECEVAVDGNELKYLGIPFSADENQSMSVSAVDERNFQMQFTNTNLIDGEFFKIATAPDIAPVTVWATASKIRASNKYDREVSFYNPRVRKASYELPAILHFPDYGLVKVETDNEEVFLQEHIIPDYSNVGLSLGPFNRGTHPGFRAYHKGTVMLSFHSKSKITQAGLKFTVLDENYPRIEGCDFTDSRFDGLKRCWQNSFPVKPVQQCMGDNILLNGIAHLSMGFKADMLVFTPDLPSKETMIVALERALEATFAERVQEDGRIKDYGWESTEVSLITLYDYLLVSNDWEFVDRHLTKIKRVVQSVVDTDVDQDGIFESPFHGNRFEENRSSLNWWDDFAFGHKDAYVNIKAYRALKGMKNVFSKLEMAEDVENIEKQLALFRSAFHKTFYNPETGVYAGWISEDGKVHDYLFTFINGMAINQGLVEGELAKDIMHRLLTQLEKEGYDFVYGVPGPAMEVVHEDRQKWDEMAQWGRYENGGMCGQTAYHFIQALYNVGMREKANEILFKMMATFEKEPTHSGVFPGYLQSVDWRTKGGAPTGYNYLADNYYFLLAAVTGYYGVKFPELKNEE
ncbi:hypothetical protein [uncultured Sunxiuqinia sp.]|uniref:hypothetical protein n=1 Tax=uncultured Sunxiuqinia sp. TaxID=1573825 RepID=UPI002AA63967|nr:hypothetical protein [uncultured Sunxiuqinia sp.]